ncbi:uncharacterized protein [Nicotiana tomentosiformis]|uniref:uncharacterized protein n=1 Tax=Nicotiana tomentosiformis TaxID=4098 RepID=UPI00388CABD5
MARDAFEMFPDVQSEPNDEAKSFFKQLDEASCPLYEGLVHFKLSVCNDFLLFCRGDYISVQMLYNYFQEFSQVFVLVANKDKSSIYFGGVSEGTKKAIMEILGFTKGEMSFRYLGVPVSTKRLKGSIAQECPILYPDLLVINICVELTKKALLAWDKVFYFTSVGGLNILDIAVWNRSAINKLLWNICCKKDKLLQVGISEEDLQSVPTFSIKNMYVLIKDDFPKVHWRKLVCNNFGAPEWIFILRLAAHGRLATKDRLMQWGITDNQWQKIARTAISWPEELNLVENYAKGRSASAEIYRMTLAASVYHIWIERNHTVFQDKQKDHKSIVRKIIQEVFHRGLQRRRLTTELGKLNWYPS